MTGPPEFGPRYRPGERVRVRRAAPPGHLRTPWYIRGRAGVVERLCGSFGNPEELAYGRSGEPRQPLYRVRFRQSEVWPGYSGAAPDTIDVEIYQHWLERAEPEGEADECR
ncbi:MAG: nitrile hydratase subunit beta [Alphaproteobacteria bacterium]|nr:nitrile hydratase subunit beta [Alphaproteobacteria bacterium]